MADDKKEPKVHGGGKIIGANWEHEGWVLKVVVSHETFDALQEAKLLNHGKIKLVETEQWPTV